MPSLYLEEHGMGQPLRLWDVDILIQRCEGLPRMDYFGHADPYIVLRIATPDGAQTFNYRTSVMYNTGQPTWNEEIRLLNVPVDARCFFQIMDKDRLSADDPIGSCELTLDLSTIAAAARSAQISSRGEGAPATAPWPNAAAVGADPDAAGCCRRCSCCELRLPIQAAPCVPVSAGCLLLALRCRASCRPPGPMLHCGPVRYRVTTSRVAGALTGHNRDGCWTAYKLTLAGLPSFFPAGALIHWNTSYDKARQVFGSPTMVSAVRAQHALLYKDKGQQAGRGVLRGGGDLVALLGGGVRARQRRYYTYVLTGDGSLCFSETGAAFFADFMSKHAMHAGCAERVVYAGEFCLLPGKLAARRSGEGSAADPAMDPVAAAAAAASSAASCSATSSTAPVTYAAAVSGERSSSRAAAAAAAAARLAEADAAVATAALEGVGGEEAGDWTLVLDNNSGTYAPPAEQLPALAALLRHNFPGLRVEVLSEGDPRLAAIRARVPSRAANRS